MKRLLVIVLSLTLILTNFVFAETSQFTDLPPSHWAYEAVMEMSSRGVISGYDDGTFRPDESISRGEFATVMVLALGLDLNENAKSSFVDLDDTHWVVPYVDAAKQYLTGYQSSAGVKFKPDQAAVREDMAVAIVRAKGYSVSEDDMKYLNDYQDYTSVSNDLRQYVGAAIKNGVMVGSNQNGQKSFNPVGILTRAEACALLLNIVEEEEKIVLEDSEIALKATIVNDQVHMTWDVNSTDGLEGFKVVASKYDHPSYPDQGYVKYLSANTRSINLSGPLNVNNGDIDSLVEGEDYYFAITAIYNNEKVTSNSVKVTYPGSALSDIILEGVKTEAGIVLEWSDNNQYSGYKVVVSKSDASPMYPEDGYYKYITQGQSKRVVINAGDGYNSGDIGTFQAGQTYFFAITGLSGDQKISSNVLKFTMDTQEIPSVYLSAKESDGAIVLEWSVSDDTNISGYKVVASKSDSSPIYPEDGYFRYITKGQEQRVVIQSGQSYNNGDFYEFKAGETYHFAITALYGNQKISSNIKTLSLEGLEEPVVKLEGYSEDGKIYLSWDSYNDSHLDGYKVVASRSNPKPAYPSDGYFRYITDLSQESVVIQINDSYHNGDFSYFEPGGYYFTITSLYDGYKSNSNTIYLNLEE